jgi:hypothetical protein
MAQDSPSEEITDCLGAHASIGIQANKDYSMRVSISRASSDAMPQAVRARMQTAIVLTFSLPDKPILLPYSGESLGLRDCLQFRTYGLGGSSTHFNVSRLSEDVWQPDRRACFHGQVGELMPPRRLEDRIRELCVRVLTAKESDWPETLMELRMAIQEHSLRVTNLASAATVAGKPDLIRERRKE